MGVPAMGYALKRYCALNQAAALGRPATALGR
jgi:hypothetical protein